MYKLRSSVKILVPVISCGFGMLLPLQTVYATGSTITVPNPSKYNSLSDIINALGTLLRPIVIILFLGLLMYGGWVRLSSRGDEEKLKSSTRIIVAAIVGFAIIVLAPVVVKFVGSLLGVQGGILDFGT